MQLTRNQEANINSIVAMSITGYYNGLNITSINYNNNEYIINVSRYLTDKCLNKLNSHFNVDIKDKYIKYELIVNKNADICRLSILNIDRYQLDMFSNETNELDILINDYNSKITNNLLKYKDLLIETLYPTLTDVNYWTFYMLKPNKIGFANKNLNSPVSIEVHKDYFDKFNYDNVYTIFGTENDAEIIRIRRTYYSKYNYHWLKCKINTPLESLWV